jgi:hypothetical protein
MVANMVGKLNLSLISAEAYLFVINYSLLACFSYLHMN